MPRTIFTDVASLEARLGLPSGFYDRLLHEDDWSFVIKFNALVEAACNHVLVVRLNAPELSDAFAHLELGNSKCGKIALLRKLGALSSEQADVLLAVAELRNDLVHDITSVRFNFAQHVSSLDANQLKGLVKRFGHGIKEVVELATVKAPRAQFVRDNPKLALWLTAAEIVACLYLELERVELRLTPTTMNEHAKTLPALAQPVAKT